MRILTLVLLTLPFSLSAQSSLFDLLYASQEPVRMEVAADWKVLLRSKKSKAFQAFTLKVHTADTTYQLPGKVRPRGNMRLQVCHYPSLKIKLKKAALRAAGFSDLNDLKVVIQCSSGAVGEGYHRRERLVYKLHTVYSDHYHRIVPFRLENATTKSLDLDAFLIEDEEQLAARYEGRILETKRVSSAGLQRQAYVNMCLFNYLVLNTDWHVFNLHNVEFVNPPESTDLIAIPYDFDYSGFVGTTYAVPREELEIKSVQTPKWLGRNVTEEELLAAARHFLSRREAAAQVIEEYPDLHKSQRRRLLKRLEDFNKLLENEKQLVRLLQ